MKEGVNPLSFQRIHGISQINEKMENRDCQRPDEGRTLKMVINIIFINSLPVLASHDCKIMCKILSPFAPQLKVKEYRMQHLPGEIREASLDNAVTKSKDNCIFFIRFLPRLIMTVSFVQDLNRTTTFPSNALI